ncbi:unnamed protein product [Pleuronectes platessa]|uniref:Uncharacterized protein n=1 Tax=Pleuronectes platessa TaxID=8262 RepID=A0A9N7W2N1_PLEPL|nr:unnamed protein product [Pleuronectes platessa]
MAYMRKQRCSETKSRNVAASLFFDESSKEPGGGGEEVEAEWEQEEDGSWRLLLRGTGFMLNSEDLHKDSGSSHLRRCIREKLVRSLSRSVTISKLRMMLPPTFIKGL